MKGQKHYFSKLRGLKRLKLKWTQLENRRIKIDVLKIYGLKCTKIKNIKTKNII